MEKEYRLKDGGLIKASSPQEFVTRLREGSKFDSHLTDDEYMKAFAERFKIARRFKRCRIITKLRR